MSELPKPYEEFKDDGCTDLGQSRHRRAPGVSP